jgi:hypothetical protein
MLVPVAFGEAQSSPGRSRFVASDSTVSELSSLGPTEARAPLTMRAVAGGVEGRWALDTSGHCVGPQAVRHRLQSDTLVVTVVERAGVICPGIVTLEGFRFQVAHLRGGRYHVQVWAKRASDDQTVLDTQIQYDDALVVP